MDDAENKRQVQRGGSSVVKAMDKRTGLSERQWKQNERYRKSFLTVAQIFFLCSYDPRCDEVRFGRGHRREEEKIVDALRPSGSTFRLH